MKPITLLPFICLVLLASQSVSQHNPQTDRQPLSYIQSSNGLASPEWEGGRTELEFADINQDGFLDIITIGDHGSPFINTGEHGIMVYFGDGQGNWAVQMTGDFGYGGIAAGDVNNDGHMDVGYAMHHNYSATDLGDQLIEVALGDGTGMNWIPWDDGLATNGEDWGMFATDFADVDNDGDLDLGSISFGCCAGIHIYLNNMDGTWTQSYGFLGGNSDMIFQFGDINNDGNMDFVVSYQDGTAYFGDGTGDFTLNDEGLPSAGSLGRYGVSLGDVNNDGYLDLAFTNSSGGLFVYIWNDLQERWDDFSGNLPSTGTYEMTQLADMNMDGYIDLAAYGRGTFLLFSGDGTGTWTEDATFTTGSPGYAKAFRVGGDVDHNGRPDMVLVEEEGSWWSYQNHLRCYIETSVPASLSVQPVFPRGNELLRPNSVRFIDWITAIPGDEPSLMKVEYSTTGSEGPWNLIAGNLPDNGRYQWIVPPENSDDCYIRYTVTSGLDAASAITSSAFAITDGTIGVKEQGSLEAGTHGSLKVWPNPAGRQLAVGGSQLSVRSSQFAVRGSQSMYDILISDLLGREMKIIRNIPVLPYHLDISDLPPGIYTLRLVSGDGNYGSAKFIKLNE